MSHHFGKRSREQLATCHADLQLIAEEALKHTQVDFAVIEGHRSLERQKLLFDAKPKLSTIDGITKKGKHNSSPSLAFDVLICGPGLSKDPWARKHDSTWTFLAGGLLMAASILLEAGRVSHRLRWGGNWDSDGTIITDQRFIDLPHFELLT